MTTLPSLFSTDLSRLQPFLDAHVLVAADIYVAEAICHTVGEMEPEMLLLAALVVRAVRFGQVCVDLNVVQVQSTADLPQDFDLASLSWPNVGEWIALLLASPAVRGASPEQLDFATPLVFDGRRLYLDRYWNYELDLSADIVTRSLATEGVATSAELQDLDAVFDRLFASGASLDEPQRRAVVNALTSRISIIAGGPGTGKTHTIARILVAAYELALLRGKPIEVVLVAPTGKAATRMSLALQHEAASVSSPAVRAALLATNSMTIHRLLSSNARGKFFRNRSNPVSQELIVVDEASMVSTSLMASLFAAVPAESSIVLVGDPYQLASVEAGAVLDEIVGPDTQEEGKWSLSAKITHLRHIHRFAEGSEIDEIAIAIRSGDAERTLELLRSGQGGDLVWVQPEQIDQVQALRAQMVDHACLVIEAAEEEDASAALELASTWKVLCPTRYGTNGSIEWSGKIEQGLRQRFPINGIGTGIYVGRPILVTKNDYLNLVMNGDTGVIVVTSEGRRIAVGTKDGFRLLSPAQIEHIETWWAMTVHKSQGSEFESVVVSLPLRPNINVSRELLYTAVSRAKRQLFILGSEPVIRAAIANDLSRSSGLRERLWVASP